MPRQAALAVMLRWDPLRNSAEDLLAAPLQKLDARDAALARHLVEQCLRHLRLLDHWLGKLAVPPDDPTRAPRPLDHETRQLLRLGLVQLRFSRIPAHAAVDATTSLAHPRSRGFVNAILRRAARDPAALDAWQAAAPPAIRFTITDFLWKQWEKNHGTTAALALAANSQESAPVTFRLNTFAPGHAAILSHPGVAPVPGHPDFYHLDTTIPGAWFTSGLIYVQDPAAALATDLLAPRPGEDILDACAAPGGKSRRLAELAAGQARITATDLAGPRLALLRGNLARLHVPGIDAKPADWSQPATGRPAYHAILIDAPCSNTGVLRRRLDARHRFTPATLAQATALQSRLLDNLAPLVRPGGRLVYSTCSLEPAENQDQVTAFLDRHPSWSPAATRQSLPHTDHTDGHFAALLVAPT